MQIKNRKLNKEESDLWKLITKNDKKIGKYVEDLDKVERKKREKKDYSNNNINLKVNEKQKNYSTNLIQVNKRTKVKLQRGLIRPESQLDLHGKTLFQAKEELIRFVKNSINKGIRCILIITGKKKTYDGSKGVIRKQLPLWLREKKLANSILYNCYAIKKDGDDGARYILLRKKEKVLND